MLYIYLQKQNIQSIENSTAKRRLGQVLLSISFTLCDNYKSKPKFKWRWTSATERTRTAVLPRESDVRKMVILFRRWSVGKNKDSIWNVLEHSTTSMCTYTVTPTCTASTVSNKMPIRKETWQRWKIKVWCVKSILQTVKKTKQQHGPRLSRVSQLLRPVLVRRLMSSHIYWILIDTAALDHTMG